MSVSGKLSRLFRRRSFHPRNDMRTTTRRTEITIETQRFVTLSRTGNVWCEGCGATVGVVSPAEAAMLAVMPTEVIYQLIEANRLHTSQQTDTQLVCFQSLRAAMAELITERENGNEA